MADCGYCGYCRAVDECEAKIRILSTALTELGECDDIIFNLRNRLNALGSRCGTAFEASNQIDLYYAIIGLEDDMVAVKDDIKVEIVSKKSELQDELKDLENARNDYHNELDRQEEEEKKRQEEADKLKQNGNSSL